MRIIVSRCFKMFLVPVSRFSVLLAGIYSILWGLWVALPMWETFPNSAIYNVMHWTGSELAWGGVQMAVGVGLVLAAFDSVRWIKWATFAGFISWTIVSLSFVIADWRNAGIWVSGYLAATNAYFFLNFADRHKKGE